MNKIDEIKNDENNQEILDYKEMKKKTRKPLSEESKEKNKKNLEKARAKLLKEQAEKREEISKQIERLEKLKEMKDFSESEPKYLKKEPKTTSAYAEAFGTYGGKNDYVDESDEIDLETLLDKKLKKRAQKTEKYEILKAIEEKNKTMFETIQKMNEKIEKMYTIKKNKIKQIPYQQQPQPIIIETTSKPIQSNKSGNEKLREILNKMPY